MQRILSEVWLSVLCGSAALSLLSACDPAYESIEERDADYADEDLEDIEADVEDPQDDVAPLTPPYEPPPLPIGAYPDGEGPIACLCTDAFDPVCGIDGETYQNPCAAFCAGVDVDHPGKCECTCTLIYDPVCGINGKTYGNACAAGCAGVEVLHEGTCTGDACTDDAECYANQFCQRDGACGGEGVCEIKADSCADKPTPVCGCDGQTYESACMAHVYGVSVASDGDCEVKTEPPPEF
jgi:hypothetical protein